MQGTQFDPYTRPKKNETRKQGPTQLGDGNFRLSTILEHHPATSPPTKQMKVTHPAALTPKFSYKNLSPGLPWWRSGWESACQCRGHGFEPWSGKILHAAEQLGPWATTTEPARLEPVLRNKRGRDSERPAHCDEEWPPLAATRESPRTETKTQHSQK